ncbi:MAG: PspA/IM30 family protein [Deltaproteobacteria bacterium]|jgi:phage shock protein A|nr:PspA/IM30 family protein [Deltaproteobacteria bacterium]
MPNVFSRFTDIISSNINAMLDKAENPKKMIKLIISEMEDTLVEIKAATAEAMAAKVHLDKEMSQVEQNKDLWLNRARQAVAKQRDDLARVALTEKKAAEEALETVGCQLKELESVIARHHDEIDQLEARISQARQSEKLITLRQTQAQGSLKVSDQFKRYDINASKLKLDRLDQKLGRLEAAAELERHHRSRNLPETDLESEFKKLDDSIEIELESLKKVN